MARGGRFCCRSTGRNGRPRTRYEIQEGEAWSVEELSAIGECDYQELKATVDLDHFEGRSWRGFHHHATLCMMALGFLALRRALFSPEAGTLDTVSGALPP